MTSKLKDLYIKYREIIMYLFFGGCTTLVNVISYKIFEMLSFSTVAATGVAWFLSVLFAYVTNRNFVFKSHANGAKNTLREAASFFACRTATGVMDVIIMFVFVDLLHFEGLLIKILSNVLVVILNYVLSKIIIFKKK